MYREREGERKFDRVGETFTREGSFGKYESQDWRGKGARYSVRCALVFTELCAPAFSKETHGGLYSVYTPIEIDIPGKVGAQQNQRNNGSAGSTFAEHGGITGKTARDLIRLFLPS